MALETFIYRLKIVRFLKTSAGILIRWTNLG